MCHKVIGDQMPHLNNIKKLIEDNIIFKEKNRLNYDNNLINRWSKELTLKYGKGYDISNLKRMIQLYLTFQNGGPVAHQLTWTNLSTILPIKEDLKLISDNQELTIKDMINNSILIKADKK